MTINTQRSFVDLFRSYGVSGGVRLLLDGIHTRLRFPACRLVRRPAYIRGRRWISLGCRFTSGRNVRMEAFGRPESREALIIIGNDVQVNDYVHIAATERVTIGDRVLIASRVFIADHNHGAYGRAGVHTDPRIPPAERPLFSSPVVIEDDVWIGEGVAILPGVRIGRGSVIGTMSIVTRDIPEYSVCMGSPATVVKKFVFDSGLWERV